jgi:hypothetical protein
MTRFISDRRSRPCLLQKLEKKFGIFFGGSGGQTPKVRLTTKVPGKSPGGPPNAHTVPVDRTVPVLAQMEVKVGRTGTAEHFPRKAEVGKKYFSTFSMEKD